LGGGKDRAAEVQWRRHEREGSRPVTGLRLTGRGRTEEAIHHAVGAGAHAEADMPIGEAGRGKA
jgi:hypothetical protein